MTLVLALALCIGFFAGLRSLAAAAATAWAARLGWLQLASPLALIGSLPSVLIFTVLALAEIVADKLPKTPSRTSPPGLITRILMGGLSGACVAAAGGQSALAGAVLGAVGGVAGCYAGYYARTGFVRKLGTPDWPVALVEDLIGVGGSLLIVSRL